VLGAAVLACTALVSFDEVQCTDALDCQARGGAFSGAACVRGVCVPPEAGPGGAGADGGGAWDCLSQDRADPDLSPQVSVQIVAFDPLQPYTLGSTVDGGSDLWVAGYTPVSGMKIQPCGALDPLCSSPIAAASITDDAGIAQVTVPGSFAGLYQMTRPDVLPLLLYPGRFIAGDTRVTYAQGVIDQTEVVGVGAAAGVTANTDPDAGLGHLFVSALDCNDRRASGVSFSLGDIEAGVRTYLVNGLPNLTATQTAADGVGGFVNVPEGSVIVSAALASQGQQALGSLNVYVKAATVTLVLVRARTR
jgi:hypothetical protein